MEGNIEKMINFHNKHKSLHQMQIDKIMQHQKQNIKLHHDYLMMNSQKNVAASPEYKPKQHRRSLNKLYPNWTCQSPSSNNIRNTHYKQLIRNISFFNIKSIPLECRPTQQVKKPKLSLIITNSPKVVHRIFQFENTAEIILQQKQPLIPKKRKSVPHKTQEFSRNQQKQPSMLVQRESLFDFKLQAYYDFIQKVCNLHQIQSIVQDCYKIPPKVFIGSGNNSSLIKSIFKKRWWWNLQENFNEANMIWSQLKNKQYFQPTHSRKLTNTSSQDTLDQTMSQRSSLSRIKESSESKKKPAKIILQNLIVLHNHFECNYYLGNKKALYYNMKAFYQSQNKDVFEYLPLTFHVTKLEDSSYRDFVRYYHKQQQKTNTKNLWIVKPGENTNRGRGISIHSNLTQINQIINSKQKHLDGKQKTYIIQQYIQKPFLYNKRKFDIRCYIVLVNFNQSIKGYWYKHGYIRTSSSQFQLEDFNTFIHLTNDAVQKNCDSYGKYEKGNKLSYHEFQKYLDTKYNNKYDFNLQVYPRIRDIAIDAIKATYGLLNGSKKSNIFEIFGLDFMIDENFKPWLIEINTNPCLQTSSPVLQRLIPNLLEDAFKVCIDPIFPPPRIWSLSKRYEIPNNIKNSLELVFDENLYEPLVQNKNNNAMGEIEEDQQIYEEDN